MSIELFAKRIRELRESKNLTTRMMAEALGISCAIISYYENAKREPTLTVMKNYAQYFDTSLDYLAGLIDDPERR